MTNTKSTKRALRASVMAMLLCFTMLLGTTFAWFTDSVTSANNIIKSGTLNVEMYYADGSKAVPADDSTDWKNAQGVAIYTADQLWEPGYTDAKHIKISNEGTLALKYQLAIIPTGEVSKLAEVIDVYLYEIADTDANATQVADRTDLDEIMWVGTLADVIGKGIVQGNLAADTDYTTTIVLKMQETADNEYQDLSIGDAFTIQLLATQLASEYDSFGNDYDKDASVFVSSAAELRNALANVKDGGTVYVNDGTYDINGQLNVAGKSVNIVGVGENAVIHMTDTRVNYNKIFYIYGSADGKDVTVNISNVTLTADVATKSDIWVRTDAQNGAKVKGNVTVNLDNVTCASIICDNNYVDGDTVNLNITNSNVKKVALDASPFNGNGLNTYTNLTYSGSRIDSITINSNVNDLTHIKINGVDPTAHGEQQPLTYVDTVEELQTALDNAVDGDTIIVSAGTYGVIDVRVNCNVTLAAADRAVVKLAGINGQTNNNTTNLTVKGIIIDNSLATEGWYTGTSQNMKPCVGVWGGNYTFEDCIFYVTGESKAETGVMSWWTTNAGTMTFKNCTFNGGNSSARAMQIYGDYDLNVEGCTFNTAKDYSIKYVGTEGLTATFKNNKVYNTVNFVQTGSAPYPGNNYTLVFEDNTLADGINNVYVDNDENQTIIVEGLQHVYNSDSLAKAVANGATDIYLLDGEYDVYGCGGKTLTLSGSRNAVLKVMNEGEDGCDYAFGSAGTGAGNITFNGLTIDMSANTGNYKGYAYMSGTYNDCAFVGGGFATINAGPYTFNKCTFGLDGYIWTWGAAAIDFNECTFTGDSRTILAHGSASTVITIKDCDFAATSKGQTNGGDWTAIVEIDPTGSNTYTINFVGKNTVSEFYPGYTRVKDGSTGHIVTGLN